MHRRVFAIVMLAAILPVALVSEAPAQTAASKSALRVDTRLVEVKAAPGTTAGDSIKLTNTGSQSVTITAFTNDVGANADGDLVAVSRGDSSGQHSASAWVSVSPAHSVPLAPNTDATFTVHLAIPKGTEAGGYYTAITFDSDQSSAPETRATHVILVNVPGPASAAVPRLVSLSIPAISFGKTLTIDALIQDTGTVHVIGTGTIEIKNFGAHVATLNFPPIVVLPNGQRLIHVVFTSPPIAGRLTATAKIDFSNGRQERGTASGFVLIWWFAILLGLVVLLFALSVLRLAGATGPKARRRKEMREAAIAAAPVKVRKKRRKDQADVEPRHVATGAGAEGTTAAAAAGAAAAAAAGTAATPDTTAGTSSALERVSAPTRTTPDPTFWGDEDPPIAPYAKVEHDEQPQTDATPVVVDLDAPHAPIKEEDVIPEQAPPVEEEEIAESRSDKQTDDDGLSSTWSQPAAASRPVPVARPVPVGTKSKTPAVPSRKEPIVPSPAPSGTHAVPDEEQEIAETRAQIQPIAVPPEEELRPAGAGRLDIRIASLPPVPNAPSLPESPWSAQPPETKLERRGGAMALRRAEVALRMITGKTGETGAILDAGLDLLYSVRADPVVVEHIENEFTSTRNRRKLGPLALALFAVDSLIAPEALLDAYASASKVVADRIRRALGACDPADIRRHRDLIAALPPARRDSLGL